MNGDNDNPAPDQQRVDAATRPVAEDAAARERSMTAEERARRYLNENFGLFTQYDAEFTALSQLIREAESAAYERGKAEERKTMMNLLGYDEYGEGLTEQRPDGDYLNHDPYYDLAGAIIYLERQKADQVCINTIKRAQARFLAAAIRARGGDDE